jgi:hypothetical protein
MVWGWDLKYYLETKTQRSSFAIVPVFLDPRLDNKKEWINVYIQDISKYRPKIIIEGVGENRFYFSDKKIWSIERVSSKLMDEIKKWYYPAKSGVNYRIFRLKNKQSYKTPKGKKNKTIYN